MSEKSQDSVFKEKQHFVPESFFSTHNRIEKSTTVLNDLINRFSGENKSMNVLQPKNLNEHVTINPQFMEYLHSRNEDRNLIIATVVGSQGVGKSFLLDSLISTDSGKTSRVMFQNKEPIVNTSTYDYLAKSNSRVQFFDVKGVTSKQNFLWLYLLSSIFILNLNEIDESQEREFLRKFQYVSKRIKVSDEHDISQPMLIIVRRDCKSQQPVNQTKFVEEIQKTCIFHPDIHLIYLPYPSKIKTAKQKIPSLPDMSLDSEFKEGVQSLSRLIKTSHPKLMKGNFYNTKLLLFSLNPALNEVNRDEHVNVELLWKDIIDNYGVEYKEGYMKAYKDRIFEEFQGQKPRKEYDVYRTLSDIKRKTDKDFIGYQNLEGDPMYDYYHEKVKKEVKEEEDEIIRLNHKYVKEYNNENCKEVMSKLNPKNYAKLIDDYNNASDFEYEKSDTLLDNFKFFLEEKIKKEKEEGGAGIKSPQLIALQNQLRDLELKINQQKNRKNEDPSHQNIEELEKSIKEKQKSLLILREEEKKVANKNENPELDELKKQNRQLQELLKKEEEETLKLCKSKHEKINKAREELELILGNEKMEYSKLQSMLKTGVRVKNAGTHGKDKTCCNIM